MRFSIYFISFVLFKVADSLKSSKHQHIVGLRQIRTLKMTNDIDTSFFEQVNNNSSDGLIVAKLNYLTMIKAKEKEMEIMIKAKNKERKTAIIIIVGCFILIASIFYDVSSLLAMEWLKTLFENGVAVFGTIFCCFSTFFLIGFSYKLGVVAAISLSKSVGAFTESSKTNFISLFK